MHTYYFQPRGKHADELFRSSTHSLVLGGGRSVQAFAEGSLNLGGQRVHGQDGGQRRVALHRAVGEALVPQVLDVLARLVQHVLALRVLVLQVLELQTGGDTSKKIIRENHQVIYVTDQS